MRSGLPALGVLLALTGTSGRPVPASPPAGAAHATETHRGVNWVAGRVVQPADLERVRRLGATWVAQTPFGWQRSASAPEVVLAPEHGYWGERDEGLRRTARLAHDAGLRVLLKPHLWVRGPGPSFPGEIVMASETEWRRWFASYRTFLLHYARLAAELEIDGLVVGTELSATVHREADWRRLIAEVRSVYQGDLTYAANWYREVTTVPFWDALDCIGVQGYYPLPVEGEPSTAELVRAWRPHLAELEALSRATGKPVLFTELGYRSAAGATARPWIWPEHGQGESPDPDLQARAYEAFFRAFWHRPWVAGVYIWKWYPDPVRRDEPHATGFSPQGKPAEAVLARWFGGERRLAAGGTATASN